MNPETQLKEIISYIEEGERIGLTPNEIMINIKGVNYILSLPESLIRKWNIEIT